MKTTDSYSHPLPEQSCINLCVTVEYDFGYLSFNAVMPGDPQSEDDLIGAVSFICMPFEMLPDVLSVSVTSPSCDNLVRLALTGLSNAPYHSHDGSF